MIQRKMPSALFSGTIIPCAFYGAPPSMHFRIALCSPYSTENAARLSPPRARCKHFCPFFFCITGLYSNRIFISLPYIYSFVNTFFAFYPHINCIFTLLYEYRRKSVKIMGARGKFFRAPPFSFIIATFAVCRHRPHRRGGQSRKMCRPRTRSGIALGLRAP